MLEAFKKYIAELEDFYLENQRFPIHSEFSERCGFWINYKKQSKIIFQ